MTFASENELHKYLDISKVNNKKIVETNSYASKLIVLGLSKNRLDKYLSYGIRDFEKLKFNIASRENVTNYDCGAYNSSKGSYACPNHVKESVEHSRKDCNKLGCPMCYDVACGRRSKSVVSRLIAVSSACYKNHCPNDSDNDWDIGYPSHVSLNPEKNIHFNSHSDYKKLLSEAIEFGKSIGILGGMIAGHPLRIDDLTQELYESPHFHLLCFGKMIKSQTFEFKGRKWRYENHGTIYTKKDLGVVCSYILSHVGLWSKKRFRKRRSDVKKRLIAKINSERLMLSKPNCSDKDIKDWSNAEKKDYGIKKAKLTKLELKLKDYSRALSTTQHYNAYAYFGICAPAISRVKNIKEVDVVSECPVCSDKLYKIKSGLKIPMVNNPKSEVDLSNGFGIKSEKMYFEIGKNSVNDCDCELCCSQKLKDDYESKKNMFGKHYGVDKSLPVKIMKEGVKFDKNDWKICVECKFDVFFRDNNRIKEIIRNSKRDFEKENKIRFRKRCLKKAELDYMRKSAIVCSKDHVLVKKTDWSLELL